MVALRNRLTMQHGTAAHFSASMNMVAHADDFVRVVSTSPRTLVAMVNAYECGWSALWPKGGSWFLDQLEALSSLGVEEMLAEARRRFLDFSRPYVAGTSHDHLVGSPGVSYTIATIEGDTVSMWWLGGDRAMLVRNAGVAVMVDPHILETTLKVERPDAAIPSGFDTVLTRCFGLDSPDMQHAHAQSPWEVKSDDTLVLVSNRAFSFIGADAIWTLGSATAPPKKLAEEIARRAPLEQCRYAAVHVTRFL